MSKLNAAVAHEKMKQAHSEMQRIVCEQLQEDDCDKWGALEEELELRRLDAKYYQRYIDSLYGSMANETNTCN